MAIKAIINNTEKEIEQIKNRDEQDIDYVYSRIGDTEVEGEPPISIKSIGENLAAYRIYGQTVNGESVGDRTGNLFDVSTITLGCYINDEGQIIQNDDINTSDFIKVSPNTNYTYKGAVIYDANIIRIAYYDQSKNFISRYFTPGNAANGETVTTPSDCEYVKLSYDNAITNLMFNLGSTPLPYEPYGYKVPVTVEGKNLLQNTATSTTKNGVTFTVNSDGSVTCNGTANADAWFDINRSFDIYSPDGRIASIGNQGSLDTFYMNIGFVSGNVINSSKYSKTTHNNSWVHIVIASGYTCDNLTLYPMIRKADIEDDTYEPYHAPVTTPIYLPEPIKMVGDEAEYIDYAEQKMHRIGADDIDVTLPALSTIKGTNTFSVNTSIQPSNMYIKDSFDYKKVFTATRTIEGELPLNYRSIEDSDSTLSNYRIYGQTVDGESVGDRTANLFDMKKFAELCSPRYASVTFADNTLSFTSTAVDAYVNLVYGKGDTVANEYRPSCIDVLPSTTYTISMSSVPKCYISWINSSFKAVSAYTQIPNNQSSYTFTTPEDCTKLLFRFGKEVTNIGDTFTISNVMLNSGSTPLPYEPYGYKVPVKVEGKNLFDENAEVTNKYVGPNGEEANGSNGDMFIVNKIAVKPDTTYTFSWQRIVLGTNNYPPYIRVSSYDSNNNFLVRDLIQTNNYPNKVCSITTPNSTAFLDIRVDDISSKRGQGLEGLMLNVGSTPLPYEPYHAPITTSIYLPEEIKKVGEEAEYIDYAEQKQHRVRKNLFYITKFINNNTQSTSQGVNFSIIDNEVYANGTSTGLYPQVIEFDYVLTEGETYAATLYIEGEYTGLPYIYCTTTYDSVGNYQKVPPNVRTIFTALPDTRILFVAQGTGESFNIKYKLLITKATIEDDTYEPYIENVDLDVTLPALPTLPGTNMLTVGAAVQPSGVEIKGHIK